MHLMALSLPLLSITQKLGTVHRYDKGAPFFSGSYTKGVGPV